MYIEFDDLRQSFAVAKNEIRKFLRSKRFAGYAISILLIFALLTVLPYLFGSTLEDVQGGPIAHHLAFVSFLALIAAILFASVTIVSEFEERTALILFTRPIKKTSIFLGKWAGCIIIEMSMLLVFYAGMAAISLAFGGIKMQLWISLSMTFLYLFAVTGIALLISSVMKKAGLSIVFTLLLLMIILPIITSTVDMMTDIDTWFMLDTASYSIIPPELLESLLPSPQIDYLRAGATMFVWGAVPTVLAWIAFLRREF
ncbi:MAG: ABC transporter permease [Methanomassiliicoccaceae archaeon]|nr:ABC transporter permease [Methanomassiliicoccaceae archaeon]